MSIIIKNLKILKQLQEKTKIQNFFAGNLTNSIQNATTIWKQSYGSWLSKKDDKPPKCPDDEPLDITIKPVCKVTCDNSIVAECPKFISEGKPSKCAEKGYGKRIRLKKYLYLFGPRKEKPSNSPPPVCKKPETLYEYIMGPPDPGPDLKNRHCRMEEEYRKACWCYDPRLCDPAYKQLEGSGTVLLYYQPQCIHTTYIYEPKPISPFPPRPPRAAICKHIHECYYKTGCRRMCTTFEFDPNRKISCPIHSKSPARPFEELRPTFPVKKTFSCKTGISPPNLPEPVRTQSCTCLHSGINKAAVCPQPNLQQNYLYDNSDDVIEKKIEFLYMLNDKKLARYERLQYQIKIHRLKNAYKTCL